MAQPVSGMDHSVAFGCLLDMYRWYAQADSRDASYVTDHLVNEWRNRVAAGSKIDCYSLAREIEQDLLDVLVNARADRTGQ